jgi:hypothetical protein
MFVACGTEGYTAIACRSMPIPNIYRMLLFYLNETITEYDFQQALVYVTDFKDI